MIKAKIIADSISENSGDRLTTFELEYPRIILSELNTHRMLSKNSSSSRAIPEAAMLDQLRVNGFIPESFHKNQAGMVAGEALPARINEAAKDWWNSAMDEAIRHTKGLFALGVHKQWANRLIEPYQMMKTVMTGSEWQNMFYLRNHPDAQPEFQYLVDIMEEQFNSSEPVVLGEDDWHLPYYRDGYLISGDDDLHNAIKISVSCCAQTSYRKSDDTLEKANFVYDKLNVGSNDDPCHASPLEHQATPIYQSLDDLAYPDEWKDGVTAYHRELGWMSGNLAGWIQYRQLVENHTKW